MAICFVPKDSNFTIFHIILITVLPVRFQKVKLCLPFVLFLGGEKRFCCPLSFWHKSSLPAIVCLFSTTCAAVVTVSGVTTPLHPNHPSMHSTFRSKAHNAMKAISPERSKNVAKYGGHCVTQLKLSQ